MDTKIHSNNGVRQQDVIALDTSNGAYTIGKKGSGKTYDLACAGVEAMRDSRTVHTINLDFKNDLLQRKLVGMGMSYYDAGQTIGRSEKIWSVPQFGRARRCLILVDESHLWWPQSKYAELNFEIVYDISMGRKDAVELMLVSQLDNAVHPDVAGQMGDKWVAYRLMQEPFYSWQKFRSRMDKTVGDKVFFYTRMGDFFGKTERRRDGTLDAKDKRLRTLDPSISRCYSTSQKASSPVLDEIREEARTNYLVSILRGKRAVAECPVCNGHKSRKILEYPVEIQNPDGTYSYKIIQADYDEKQLFLNTFARAKEIDCEFCDTRGFWYDPNHPDYQEAQMLKARLDSVGRKKMTRE